MSIHQSRDAANASAASQTTTDLPAETPIGKESPENRDKSRDLDGVITALARLELKILFEETLALLTAVLRPGGRLLLGVPNAFV